MWEDADADAVLFSSFLRGRDQARARGPLCLGQSWACGRCSAGVRDTRAWHASHSHPHRSQVLLRHRHWWEGLGSREGAPGVGAAVHPGGRHFMVCLLGMTFPQCPSHCDGSDPLFCLICPPSLILLGGCIPLTGTSVGPNPTSQRWEGLERLCSPTALFTEAGTEGAEARAVRGGFCGSTRAPGRHSQ